MTVQSREWLPISVLTHDVIREALETAVAQWTSRWFVGDYARIAGMKAAPGAPRNENEDSGWRVYRAVIALRGDRSNLSRLVDRVLDTDTETLLLTEGDQYIIEGMRHRILEDLAETVEQTFGTPGRTRTKPQKLWDPLAEHGGGLLANLVETSGREILSLAIPAGVLVPSIKAHLGSGTKRTKTLRPLIEALGAVPIQIEAMIGRAELTLVEFRDLAVGDVLVLDRALDQAIDVASVKTHQTFAKARLTDAEDGMALVIDI